MTKSQQKMCHSNQKGRLALHRGAAKQMPPALDAERALLGAILHDPGILPEVRERVDGGAFLDRQNSLVYRSMCALADEGGKLNIVSLGEDLARHDLLIDAGGAPTIAGLLRSIYDGTASAAYWRQYAGIIKKSHEERTIRRIVEDAHARMLRTANPKEVLAELREQMGAIEVGSTAGRSLLVSSRELAESTAAHEYLIEDVLVAGQPGILAAPRKALKTSIGIDAAISGASGTAFLGVFPVPRPFRVGFFSGESGQATIRETASRICHSKGLCLSDLDGALWRFDVPSLNNPNAPAILRRTIEREGLEVLFLDPTYLMLDGADAGNLFSVGARLKPLAEIGADTGCSIWLVHHHKKGVTDPHAMPCLDDIAWSGFAEFARQWLLLSRRCPYDPDRVGEHRLWLATGGSAGHGGGWGLDVEEGSRADPGGRIWVPRRLSVSEALAEMGDAREKAKLDKRKAEKEATEAERRGKAMRALEHFRDGETARTLADFAGLSRQHLGEIVRRLTEEGVVERVNVSKNARQYDGYRLAKGGQGATGTTGTT